MWHSFLLIVRSVSQFLLSLGSCEKLRAAPPDPPPAPGSRRSPAPTTTSSAVTACSLRSFLSNAAQLLEFSSYLMGLDKSRRWPGPCPRLNSRYSKSCLRNAGLFSTSAGGCSDAAVPSGPAADGCAGSSAKKHHFLLSPRRLRLHKEETSLEQPPTAVAVEQKGLPHVATGPSHAAAPRSARLVLAGGGRCSLGSALPSGQKLPDPSQKGRFACGLLYGFSDEFLSAYIAGNRAPPCCQSCSGTGKR